MKVGKQFNTLTPGEYLHLLQHHRKYTDFNTLGLFRSLLENPRLSLAQQLELRQAAIAAFPKPFEFLQLKDPVTYFELNALGESLTSADKAQAWTDIRHNQQRMLTSKQLRHRNFGTYSKHLCGHDDCPLNGLMIKKCSALSYPAQFGFHENMPFASDKNRYSAVQQAKARRRERKQERRLLAERRMEE